MPNNLTDAKIKKALECCLQSGDDGCPTDCPLFIGDDSCFSTLLKPTLDLINRQEQELRKCENVERLADKTIATLQAENESLKAEVERLQNAYKQCAWERDIFAEDMTQEIKKDCSYLMLDIKTIKAEAYKEAFDKVKEELKNIAKIDWQGGYYYLVGEAFFDNLLNELVGG